MELPDKNAGSPCFRTRSLIGSALGFGRYHPASFPHIRISNYPVVDIKGDWVAGCFEVGFGQ